MKRAFHQTERAQALVEFVILLIVFMAMITGMLYFFRLHLYQFWAQQEARYLAFEQTWVPHAYYKASGEEPKSLLEGDASSFRRPGVVSGLDVTREETENGSMSDLIPGIFAKHEPEAILPPSPPSSPFIETAFATLKDFSDGERLERIRHRGVRSSSVPQLDVAIQERLHRGGFGETFCNAGSSRLGALARSTPPFSALNCVEQVERDLARTLARETHIPDLFREMSDLVEAGVSPQGAIENSLRDAVAEGYATFFKTAVDLSTSLAPIDILVERGEVAAASVDSSISRMISDLRYIGSSAAILALLGEAVAVGGSDFTERSSQSERDFEKTLQDILHVDAANILPIIGDGYLLNPTYLPVPPKFGPLAGGLLSGIMRSVLSLDSDDEDELIDNSVRRVDITYDSAKGLFSGAERRYRTGVKHNARFIIDTNPWHIERRLDGTGDYADKGEEFDTVNDNTDEGRLRRRVNGMWLFPTPPDAFFEPILSFVGLEELTSLVDAFRPVGDFISVIKSMLTNNPIFELFNTLSELPIIGSFIPNIPVWPVVRPDAYPTSTEMQGDRKMGNSRNFQDYVDEQREFNPEPEPDFN